MTKRDFQAAEYRAEAPAGRRDLVDRLVEASGYALMSAARETVLEAAAEIRRLRAVANHDAARRAALEKLSALDQKLELEYGLVGNPLIKAQQCLTDAEREAVSFAYETLCQRARELQAVHAMESSRRCVEASRALQGLFERMGGRQ